MPISYQHKTIFIHIPKCAGTSIEKILGMAAQEDLFAYDHIYQLKNIHVPKEKFTSEEYTLCIAKTPQHLTFRELKKIVPEDSTNNFFKFSIVRNPFSKFVSEYNYIKSLAKHSEIVDIMSLARSLTFDSFKRIHRFDAHLETQTSFLINESGKIESSIKLYKFEDLSECFSDILKIGPIDYQIHARKNTDTNSYKEYYTKELIEVVKNFYKDDFLNFNYSTEL